MLTVLDAILLGVVEGLTEFVPVSSTGHLILVDRWLGHEGAGADAFEIVIQLGALIACVLYYRRVLLDLARGLLRGDQASRRLATAIGIGFLPAAIVGFLFHQRIEATLFGARPVGMALLVGGIIMIAVDLWRRRQGPVGLTDLAAIRPAHGLWVGLAQCASLIPGTSRSMATIVGGQLAGLETRLAADFAFLVGIPTLGAACLYKLVKARHVLMNEVGPVPLLVGLGVSFLVGWLVIAAFLRFLGRTGLVPFGIYRVAIAAFVLFTIAR